MIWVSEAALTLCMYLHSGLAESEPLAELFPHERVRVVGLVEEPLQLVQLLQGEVCATPPRFVALVVLLFDVFVALLDVRAGGRDALLARCGEALISTSCFC